MSNARIMQIGEWGPVEHLSSRPERVPDLAFGVVPREPPWETENREILFAQSELEHEVQVFNDANNN